MQQDKKISSALLSVYDKTGILELAQALQQHNVLIYSTGGTQSFLEKNNIPVIAIESVTNYPEIFGGRVKTLHPAVFGGILYRRDNQNDLAQLKEHAIPNIDLVVVDLYPFEDTVAGGGSHNEIIEKIDIGGISLIRAAAKNYAHTTIVPSKTYYTPFLAAYKEGNGVITEKLGKLFATVAFEITSKYDNAIASYLGAQPNLNNKTPLRYGENPHQNAHFEGNLSELFTQLSGKELSYNNLLDVDAAVNLVMDLSSEKASTFAILKHNNACGCAQRTTVKEAYLAALAADPLSAFGGVFICDKTIDLATAQEIDQVFYEICIAPSYDKDAETLLTQKKNRILLKWSPKPLPNAQVRTVLNGKLLQERDTKVVQAVDFSYVTEKRPSLEEMLDLEFANTLVKHTKSNAIILVKNGQLLASGTGQTSRVDALQQAVTKAKTFNFNLKGAVMASDAFFPFPDCVEIAGENEISAIVQPGGSIKDNLSIDKANELGLAMVTTGIRHFKH